MQSGRNGKLFFSEPEAARFLGVTVDEFRLLLRRYIVERDEDLTDPARTAFHASDLLVLKMMATKAIPSTAAGPTA